MVRRIATRTIIACEPPPKQSVATGRLGSTHRSVNVADRPTADMASLDQPSRKLPFEFVLVADIELNQPHFCAVAAQAILKTLEWRSSMAKLVFGLNQSLDGYVDHQEFAPGSSLFRHFIEQVRDLTGSVYGSRMYEVMRYWDEDSPKWGADERDFAAAWRSQPKWVVSHFAEVSRPERHSRHRRHRDGDTGAKGRARWGDRSRRTRIGAKPDRPWSHR